MRVFVSFQLASVGSLVMSNIVASDGDPDNINITCRLRGSYSVNDLDTGGRPHIDVSVLVVTIRLAA